MSPLEKIISIAATARYEPDPRRVIAELAAAIVDLVEGGPEGVKGDEPALPKIEG